VGLSEETRGGGKENVKEVNIEIHYMCVRIRQNKTHWKLFNDTGQGERVRKSNRGSETD
jgi:hypothetical protein